MLRALVVTACVAAASAFTAPAALPGRVQAKRATAAGEFHASCFIRSLTRAPSQSVTKAARSGGGCAGVVDDLKTWRFGAFERQMASRILDCTGRGNLGHAASSFVSKQRAKLRFIRLRPPGATAQMRACEVVMQLPRCRVGAGAA